MLKLHQGVHAIVPLDPDPNSIPRNDPFLLILKEPMELGLDGIECRVVIAQASNLDDGSILVYVSGTAETFLMSDLEKLSVGWAPLDPFLAFTSS